MDLDYSLSVELLVKEFPEEYIRWVDEGGMTRPALNEDYERAYRATFCKHYVPTQQCAYCRKPLPTYGSF